MKLMIIYHAGAVSGAREIYRALCALGAEVVVIAPEVIELDPVWAPPSGRLVVSGEETQGGYRMVPVPLRNPRRYAAGFEPDRLRKAIAGERPDVIQVLDEAVSGYLFQATWAAAVSSRGSRLFFYAFENQPYIFSKPARLKWSATWRRMAGGAGANKEAIENVRLAGFPSAKPLKRIPWGISIDHFHPSDRARARATIGVDAEWTVGFIGRLVPEKGLRVLLAAMSRLPESVHCLIIGDGPMRAELELWAGLPALSGRVHLHGLVALDDLPAFINSMDVLILPSIATRSWREQYGRVLAEAMACGVPVVGSNSGAIPEVIGTAGVVVPEGDASALAAAIERLLGDPRERERLSEAGIQRARKDLSVAAMAQQFGDLYDEAV